MDNREIENSWNSLRKGIQKAVDQTSRWAIQDLHDRILGVPYSGLAGHRNPTTGKFTKAFGKDPAASNPGEPPRFRSSKLRDSAHITNVSANETEASFDINVGGLEAPYAGYLEDGTDRMARRPFIELARNRAKERLKKELPEGWITLL